MQRLVSNREVTPMKDLLWGGVACIVVGVVVFLIGGYEDSPINFYQRPYWMLFGVAVALGGIIMAAVAAYKRNAG